MAKFCVNAPAEGSLGFPERVSEHKTADAALDAAMKFARANGGFQYTVQVEEDGSQNTWTVQYHPEPLMVGSVGPDGVPTGKFPVEFRIVHDGRESVVEEGEDEAGNTTRDVGKLAGPWEQWDLEADDDS